MTEFKVSVIIPAYNSTRTIGTTLKSIYEQTRRDLVHEVIVVNDGSTDDTASVVEQFSECYADFPIKLINKENGGVSTARNLGMSRASGSWIALCDSDDAWFPDKLELQHQIIQSNGNIDFLGGNHTDAVMAILGRKIDRLYSPTIKELCIKMFPQTSTVIFRKEIYDEIGGFDVSRRYGEDGQYFMKICDKYRYYYHPQQVIEFDGGRRGFGVSGLSGNLKGMQDGQRRNIKELFSDKKIDMGFYVFIKLYIELKYVRRLLICKVGKR